MSKSKVNVELSDFQIGMKVRLNTDEKNIIMSVHKTMGNIVYCDFVDDKNKHDRKGFHYKQLDLVEE
jgi:hypothetical protein